MPILRKMSVLPTLAIFKSIHFQESSGIFCKDFQTYAIGIRHWNFGKNSDQLQIGRVGNTVMLPTYISGSLEVKYAGQI